MEGENSIAKGKERKTLSLKLLQEKPSVAKAMEGEAEREGFEPPDL